MDAGGGVPGFGTGWPAFVVLDSPRPPAAACATWVLTLFATVVQATVPSSASPIAPPTCWAVLSRLEATPESCSATLCRATRASGTNTRPTPGELTRLGPSSWLPYPACSVSRENQNIPPATAAVPATISGRGPICGTSCEASAEAITTPTANGR